MDLLLPRFCAGCGQNDVAVDGLCCNCSRDLLALTALPYCPRCGATVGPGIPLREDGCAACPHPLLRFGQVVRLGPYAGPLRQSIRHRKYHRNEQMLKRFGVLLAETITTHWEPSRFDVILPVPMHWRRRWTRGYDHAHALGHQIGRCLGLPVGNELIRVRFTPPQTSLSRSGRLRILRGAFDVTCPATVEGANVLLVDDVTTTGATANETARTLLSHRASRVMLAVIAKAEPPSLAAAALRKEPNIEG